MCTDNVSVQRFRTRRTGLEASLGATWQKMVKKRFDAPEETRSLHKGKIEVVDLGGVKVKRVIHEPGWRWSECVKPDVGTNSCQVGHLIHVISGWIVNIIQRLLK